MGQQCYLGIDLGAESGRVVAGLFNGQRVQLEELHRFPNGAVNLGGSLRWDVLRLWSDIQNGLSARPQNSERQSPASVSIHGASITS